MNLSNIFGSVLKISKDIASNKNVQKAVAKTAFDVVLDGKPSKKKMLNNFAGNMYKSAVQNYNSEVNYDEDEEEYYDSRGISTEYLDEYNEKRYEYEAEDISYEDYAESREIEDYGLCDDELGDEDRDDS